MKWKAGSLTLGPFNKGMNTAKGSRLLAIDEFMSLVNVDLADGTLRGLIGPGSSLASVATGTKHIHYAEGIGWESDTLPQFHCYDTVYSDSGDRFSFFTNSTETKISNGNVGSRRLGADPPSAAPTLSGGTGPSTEYVFRYTYISNRVDGTYTPLETNPSPISASSATTDNIDVGVVSSGTAAIDGIKIYRATYSTADGAGIFYHIATVADSTANYTHTGTETNGTELTWDIGGVNTNATYQDDHSPAPTANVISNALHTARQGGSQLCTGILFFGVGNTVGWSQPGQPWYVPVYNYYPLDGYVEAIVSNQATTYVLLSNGIYVFVGTDDENLSLTRSQSYTGTIWGHSAVMTPYGLMFQASNGIGLFDGNTSRIITEGVLAANEFANDYACTWHDNQLIMVSQTDLSGGYVLDFAYWPEIRATKHNVSTQAITLTGSLDEVSPYVAQTNGGAMDICPWRPRQRDVGSSLAWTATTGRMDLGMSASPKRWIRVWVECTGTISILVTCGNGQSTTVDSMTITDSSWLKDTFYSDWLQLTISSADGTGVVNSIEIEYEAADNASQ